jgi:glutathione S-transferase
MCRKMIELKFYHRQGCHLCEEMWQALSEMSRSEEFKVIPIDIDQHVETKQAYGLRIPCLEGPDGHTLSEHFLDPTRVLSYLRDV